MRQHLIRLEVEIDALPLLQWLRGLQCDTMIYWACRQGDLEIAAIGLADSIDPTNTSSFGQAISTVETRLKQSSSGIRYFGGRCFDSDDVECSEWGGFGQYRFIVPQYEIVRSNNTYTLAQNVYSDSDVDVQQLKDQLLNFRDVELYTPVAEQSEPPSPMAAPMSRTDIPGSSEWIDLARQLVNVIQSGDVEKVVLAHRADITHSVPFHGSQLLEQMKSRSLQTYNFLFQFPGSGVFLGASPECLFKKNGREIYSEAIAGTRPVAHDPNANLQLQHQLRQSDKEQHEHDYVAENIMAALKPLCHQVCSEPGEILQTGLVQHLYTRFFGNLRQDTTTLDIIKALHPTAAVNGFPTDKAKALIRSLEPFGRGWYAGAVGWIMPDQAEFAVGIRSALIQQNQTLSVFSGAGIVKDSDPGQEWAETELKKRLILEAAKEIVG